MAYFRRKNLIEDVVVRQRNRFLKAGTLFLLGASASLLLANADLVINPQISNSIAYIKQFFVTSDGTTSGNLGVILQSSGVFATKYCDLSGSDCKTITELSDMTSQLPGLSSLYVTSGQVDDKISDFSLGYLALNYYDKTGVDLLVSQAAQSSRDYLTDNYYDKTEIDAKGYLTGAQINALAQTLGLNSCTDGQVPQYNGTVWGCTTLGGGGITEEVDPQVGSLVTGKWCTSDGTEITCNEDAPAGVLPETDPLWIAASGNYYTKTYINANYYPNTTINSMFMNAPFFSPNTYGCGAGYITEFNGSSAWECIPSTNLSVSKLLINTGSASELYGPDTCSGANEGAIRFNKSDAVFEGCDGDLWFIFSGSTHPDA